MNKKSSIKINIFILFILFTNFWGNPVKAMLETDEDRLMSTIKSLHKKAQRKYNLENKIPSKTKKIMMEEHVVGKYILLEDDEGFFYMPISWRKCSKCNDLLIKGIKKITRSQVVQEFTMEKEVSKFITKKAEDDLIYQLKSSFLIIHKQNEKIKELEIKKMMYILIFFFTAIILKTSI